MIKKYIKFVNESISNDEMVINVKKHIKKGEEYIYDDSDWDINPFHEFDEINNSLHGKEVFFVANKIYSIDDDNFHGEIGIFNRLSQYKNKIYIHFYKYIGGNRHAFSGILRGDIIVIKEKKMDDLYYRDKVWYHLGVKQHEWLYCDIVAFDVKKSKVFIVDWQGDHTYPFTFWVEPNKLYKIKP
jgi:hypothetical protein